MILHIILKSKVKIKEISFVECIYYQKSSTFWIKKNKNMPDAITELYLLSHPLRGEGEGGHSPKHIRGNISLLTNSNWF